MLGKNRGKARPRKIKRKILDDKDNDTRQQQKNLTADSIAPSSVIPAKVGSDLSLFAWADNLEPRTLEIAIKCE
jgi:hypothetical protein